MKSCSFSTVVFETIRGAELDMPSSYNYLGNPAMQLHSQR